MSMPVLKLRQVVGFPGNIVGGTGIEATKLHGTVTVDMQWNEFGAIDAIPTSPTSYILTFDTATQAYVMVPSHLLGGAVAGIADAPNDGIQYGRQSGTWTATATGGGLTDAPSDGTQYGRKNAAWTAITSLTDAPLDGTQYARRNGAWTGVPPPGIGDAPSDSISYARRNATWTPVSTGSTFLQAGIGAITRTMQNKVRECVSVTDFGAIGDSNQSRAAANTTAIQNAINQVASLGGGVVFIPTGNYVVAPGINVPSSVRLVGAGKSCSGLELVWGTDAAVVTLGPDGEYMGLENLSVVGYIRNSDGTGISSVTGAAATYPCVSVPAGGSGGPPVFISNCFFEGGRAGLLMHGSDGCLIDNFIWGWHAALESYGSNSYIRCKFDSMNNPSDPPTLYGYFQSTPPGAGAAVIENVFTNCDFSGNYNYSVWLQPHADDVANGVANRMIPHFYACAMSRDIILTYTWWASFVSCELGHIHASNNSQISLVNCFTPGGTGGIHNDDGTNTYKSACCFNISGAA
jgi:hypothetical protein